MKKILLFLTITFTFTAGLLVTANRQDEATAMDDGDDFLDPFVSQLPQKEIVQPSTVAPTSTAATTAQQVQATPEIPVTPPTLDVTGVVWNTSRPQAIINGKVVDVGDIISEATIREIKRGGIAIDYHGKNFTIVPNQQQAQLKGNPNEMGQQNLQMLQ